MRMSIWLTSATQSAYNEGINAAGPVFRACGDIQARICPYEDGTNEYRAWHDGLQHGTDAIIRDMEAQVEVEDSPESAS